MLPQYDVIVVGGGHAGCEAAAAAANLGSKTLLVTMDMTKFAQMSCNPAMGGIAKGQIVREIDALGGYAGIVSDRSAIQFRMLNSSKGPAMWSPRAQCDRTMFTIEWRKILESLPNLDLWQGTVTELIVENQIVTGVKIGGGVVAKAKAVVLTVGTFLNGLMHVGTAQMAGGRSSEPASYGITEQLKSLGIKADRMKTGTPVRIDGRTIDYQQVVEQKGDENPRKFSFLPLTQPLKEQQSCYMVYTDSQVHKTLETGFAESPMFAGRIKGVGPRYCPSIEDKVVRFADKDRHLLFLEPEGTFTNEFYLNGFSSSLPFEVQYKALKQIKGLENVKVFRPGYAIEYDYFDPTQLHASLETKIIENLFFAGQINGTTGYEEAGGQGLMAGINAHQKVMGKPAFILQRDEAYIGVLIDDLVTKGVNEPYRMFTSRAEFRILLRQDNADARLTEYGYQLGLATKERYEYYLQKKESIEKLIQFCKDFSVKAESINETLERLGTAPTTQSMRLSALLTRPQVTMKDLIEVVEPLQTFIASLLNSTDEVIEAAEIEIKYSGYIERERALVDKTKRLENVPLSDKIDYLSISSLSTESRQKLNKIRPTTIGQASRISGVSPSDINILLVYIGR